MSIHGVLGEATSYPKHYDPSVLYAIPRSLGRDSITLNSGINVQALSIGMDWWHAFEVSWLNLQGISQVALARFSIPANSANIVESKSLKLYLNSLNFSEFADWQAVKNTIGKDLSACVEQNVEVELFALDEQSNVQQNSSLLIDYPQGQCIDNVLANTVEKIALLPHPDASLLQGDLQKNNSVTNYQLYSNLLRSNCPVTNQPDWGTLAISISTDNVIVESDLLKYILSYRQHNGFHEQCVEQIFADLMLCYQPQSLTVRAWYTRRGGIDINPCRVSDISLLPTPSRLIRQ